MYKKIDGQDLEYFKTFLDEDRILLGDDITDDFHKDELGTVANAPEVVLRVKTAEEISKIVKHANEFKIPIVVRGSGTGLVGGSVPIYGGVVLDMTLMNHIVDLDDKNMILEVEAGTLIMDIYDYVESKGFFYAPDPGEKTATIGGTISTNAGGMRAVKYGVTRDWIVALEVVLPTGEITQLGRKVAKNSTGYSLKDLVIGSEGTLAIVTKAFLKLAPLPEKSISLLVPFDNVKNAIESVPKLLQAKIVPTATEFFEKDTIGFSESFLGKKFPESRYDAYILLTFDGMNDDEINTQLKQAADLYLDEYGAEDVLIVDTDERKDDVWSARGAFLEAIKASTTAMDECDVVVPRDRIAEYIGFTHELSEKYQVRIPSFGHAGDGNLHIYICKDDIDDQKWSSLLDDVFDELYQKAKEMEGLVSGEHGIGFAKKKYMEMTLGKKQLELMRGVKRVFDPNNILNPDKVI